MEKTRNNNASVASALIIETLRFLEQELSYHPNIKRQESPLFSESVDVIYINNIRRRQVRFSYSVGDYNSNRQHSFSCSITRLPYTDFPDFFSLSIFLESIHKDFPAVFVGEFDVQKAQSVLTEMAISLREHCWDILEGRIWLDRYYPRKD